MKGHKPEKQKEGDETVLPLTLPYVLPEIDPETDPLFTSLTEEDEERDAIWRLATPAFRQAIIDVAGWTIRDCHENILSRYQLGEVIKGLKDDDEHGGRRYGYKSVERICKFLSWGASFVYSSLQLVEAFSRKRIEELSRMRLRDGLPLTFLHLHSLAQVDNTEKREELLQRTLAESWSGHELAEVVHGIKKAGKSADDRRGRPLAIPRTLDALIRQQGRIADDFLARGQRVWGTPKHSLDAKARELTTEEVTEERAESLRAHAEKLRLLAEEAQKRAAEASLVHEEFRKALAFREKHGGS